MLGIYVNTVKENNAKSTKKTGDFINENTKSDSDIPKTKSALKNNSLSK
jgi:hypothetical protein